MVKKLRKDALKFINESLISHLNPSPTDPTVITCVTPPKNTSDQLDSNLVISVSIDNWKQPMTGFEYVQDPTFASIFPDYSFATYAYSSVIYQFNTYT